MVSTRNRGRKRGNSSPPKELPKKSRKTKKGKQAAKKTKPDPVEEKPAEETEAAQEVEVEEKGTKEQAQSPSAPQVMEKEKAGVEEKEPVAKETKAPVEEEAPTFDKEKALEKVNKIMQLNELPEGSEKAREVVDKGEDVPVKEKTSRGQDTNTRRLYMQLKELRTTEVEQLLKDARETAATKEKAQNELIQELTAEVMRLKAEKEDQNDGKIQWKKEYVRLKASTEKLRNEVEELRNGKSENVSAIGNGSVGEELERLGDICKFYQELTALRVEIKETQGVCIATNKTRRKAVRFEIEFCENEKKQACFRFTPTANVSTLPKDLSQSKVFKHQDAQKLLSRVWESLDQE